MKRNPALIDLNLFLAKTKVNETKIRDVFSLRKEDENLIENVDNSKTEE